ncbi:MAG: hypothetical protein LQ348_004438 [Seirophora lacunosa]|nr:MAG: hypothetical protein LQ344_007952 [Seirophora lacunosa]KAI4185021.1 MAG: hypothetical protein LQ348_004438 [Seirophora lacunosa]
MESKREEEDLRVYAHDTSDRSSEDVHRDTSLTTRPKIPFWRITISLLLLFLNYFLAQYDKFILSYFQDDVIRSLDLSSSSYGVLSGYATGIVYALLALPTAFVADYTSARVWVLTAAAVWWSLCAIFQGLSHNFWQILLARIGMGIGQAPVEALSVSLISDLLRQDYVFFGESVLYVGVYIGEAVSGQIAVAFARTGTPWNTALVAVGIVGVVIALLVRIFVREPKRQISLVMANNDRQQHPGSASASTALPVRLLTARKNVLSTFRYLARMRSFYLLTLSAAFRQLGGNVFGYYMPSYLSNLYPSEPSLLSRYGIIVGVVGSVAVLSGGLITSLMWSRTKLLPLYLTAVGGMISSIFVLLMLFSLNVSDGDPTRGVRVLYGTMSIAYLTAELWLGAINSLIALLLPPHTKTFGLAIWSLIQVLIYSSGPQIVGLSLRNTDPESSAYLEKTRIALAVMIPVGYWLAGIGFLLALPLVKLDIAGRFVEGRLQWSGRRGGFLAGACVLVALVVALFIVSIYYSTSS